MPVNPSPHAAGWNLSHSYASLPSLFHRPSTATAVKAPAMVIFNTQLAAELGLEASVLDSPQGAAIFAGNTLPPGAQPLAQAYAGHQFGHFTTLGDGRAILLGEQTTPAGKLVDIQLKGPGRTMFSRGGDGRAAVGPMLREYIISEAMHAMGIPTTRSLAVVATGEPVYRQEVLPGAVLTRTAASHIRVGTFQWAAAQGEMADLTALADYTLQRHYPEATSYVAMLEAIMERQASLVARWLSVGFIHGVMNTDNMALSGETIDYGPCAFMDSYDPATVFSSIDHQGRYAFGNQPTIARWNLARLAEAMLPLLDPSEQTAIDLANGLIQNFPDRFQHYYQTAMRAKLGIFNTEPDDASLIDELLREMQTTEADYTRTFRSLTSPAPAVSTVWLEKWQARLTRQPQTRIESDELMNQTNPIYIPRNHKVEKALTAATNGDYTPLKTLLTVVQNPYHLQPDKASYAEADDAAKGCYKTFCGT